MELYGFLFLTVIVIGAIWRKSVKRIAQYSEDMVTVNTSEGQLELVERSNVIAERLEHIGNIRVGDLDMLFASKGITGKSKKTA